MDNFRGKTAPSMRRAEWFDARLSREALYHQRYRSRIRPIDWFDLIVRSGCRMLKLVGMYDAAHTAAKTIHLKCFNLACPTLPESFDGYTILHVSDLHFGCVDGTCEAVADAILSLSVDLCVFTGDYREGFDAAPESIVPPLRRIKEAVNSTDGFLATLGNHDTVHMVDPIETLGIRVLGNETIAIHRNADCMFVTGIDDAYAFSSPAMDDVVAMVPPGFNLLLSHSPDMAAKAAAAGVDLFLCGHTHGGQICLPGGRPIVTRTRTHRDFAAAGVWRHGRMVGVTNAGAGTSHVPLRINTQGEVCLITLTQNPDKT